MADVIQDPFEDFPERDIIASRDRIYWQNDIEEWRSKHEVEIRHNAEIVQWLKEEKRLIENDLGIESKVTFPVSYEGRLIKLCKLRLINKILGDNP